MRTRSIIPLAFFAVTLITPTLPAQQTTSPPASKKDKEAQLEQTCRVTLQVSGGDSDKPIENASVYVKYVDEKTVMKGKKLELNSFGLDLGSVLIIERNEVREP